MKNHSYEMIDKLESQGLRLIAAHNHNVQTLMGRVVTNFLQRLTEHDQSKYSEQEYDLVIGKPHLDTLEYNSDEYREGLERVRTAVDSHYKSNRHHPEHWPEGTKDMSLLDLLEMACDWQAASIEHNSTFLESIKRNVERFNLSVEVQYILMNTARELGWIDGE